MFKNMAQMMQQAQQMQEKMQNIRTELENTEHQGVAGGGMVTVRVMGKNDVKQLDIDPSLMKVEEKQVLEDLVVAAVNDALSKAQTHLEEQTQQAMGGLPLPPGFKLPF